MPLCPQCNSERLYKDGLRYLKDGNTVQRWLCRSCGYRFSEARFNNQNKPQHLQKVERQILNSPDALTTYCQGSSEATGRAPTARTGLVQTLAEIIDAKIISNLRPLNKKAVFILQIKE